MPNVFVWRTLTGVVALTDDSFGFSYCADQAEIDKFRSDLQSGVPMAQAVGFSGSSCGLGSLVRVESKQNSPTVFVVGRDFLGKSKEDFTFRHQSDREAFFEALLPLLGPNWRVEEATRGGCGALILPIGLFLFGFLGLLCGGIVAFAPGKTPPDPAAAPPPSTEVMLILMGFNVLAVVAAVIWLVIARKMSKIVWETIRKK